MISTRLQDGRGSQSQLGIDNAGAASVVERPLPPFSGPQKMRVFQQFLTDDGTSTGSTDMTVDGSATNVDFWVPAHEERDRYICMLDFVIADAGLGLNEFGNVAARSNGCRLFYEDQIGEVTINDNLVSNFEFIRMCNVMPPIGATTSSFIASNVSGTSEGIIPKMDLRQMFGFKWGVKLAAGSTQRLVMTIRDDCTDPDQFDVKAYGFERFKD